MPQDYSHIIQDIKDWLFLNPDKENVASVWDEFGQKISTSYGLNNQSFRFPIYNHSIPNHEERTNFNDYIEEIKDIPSIDKYWLKAFKEIFEKFNALSWNVKVRRLNQQFDAENWQLNNGIDQIANYPNQYEEIFWTKKNTQQENVKTEEEKVDILEKPGEDKVGDMGVGDVNDGDGGGGDGDKGDDDKGDDDPPLRKTIGPIRKGRFFGSAAVIAGLVAVWYFWGGLSSPATWLAKETNYSIAEDLVLRSSPNAENDDNKIDALYYGAKVSVLKAGVPWTKVKFDDKKGYVHSKYLIDEVDYTILNSAFEDSETLRFIPKSRYKKAILSYYLTNGICGKLSTEEQERIFGKGITKPIWTIKAYYSANENWVRCDQKVYNSASIYNDLVFIIKSANNERKIVLYSFLPDETPFLLDVQYYPYKFPIVNYWYNPNGTYGKDKLQYECSNLNQNYNGY